jgi:hypothetical protein
VAISWEEMFGFVLRVEQDSGNYFISNNYHTKFMDNIWWYFFLLAQQPPLGKGLLTREVSRSHTTTQYVRYDSSGRVISSSQRPLSDNTQLSLQTDIHAPGGFRTHNLRRRAAADLRLRPRGPWDRLWLN